MIRRTAIAAAIATLAALALPGAAGAAQPAWQLVGLSLPTNLVPGSTTGHIVLIATNVGAGGAEGGSDPIVFEDTLPPGLTPTGAQLQGGDLNGVCTIAPPTVTCTSASALPPTGQLAANISVEVAPGAGPTLLNEATVRGGGGAAAASAQAVSISSAVPPFGFLSGETGLSAPLTGPDGFPATGVGSHPYQLITQLGFPALKPAAEELSAAGHLRDAAVDLPRGEIVDPAATPVRCREAELVSRNCPPASQIGLAFVITPVFNEIHSAPNPLFNMVPPAGIPSSFGFLEIGVTQHIFGSLRSDSDFGLSGTGEYILGRGSNPILAVQLQFWGDPTAAAHSPAREGEAKVPAGKTALLSAPGRCSGSPERTRARADDWEEPGLFKTTAYESADLEGNPVALSGCNALEYEPTISSQPTTNVADSPSGLTFDLHQPQEQPHLEPANGRATAKLREARVTLPAGMAVNPSQADGLEACSEQQIGYLAEAEEVGIHFSKATQGCPDAAKLGTLEATTPLLAEYTEEGTHRADDPETGAPIPRPLHGSVYLAQPYENPLGTLLAIYLVIEDPQSGTVAKLIGGVEADPQSGQLTTVVRENPELPLEDIRLKLFGGARGALITPLTCATHTINAALTPWSAPEGQVAHPSDSFHTVVEPGGGNCPASEDAASNSPAFSAGTLTPQAGAYTPFVLKLSRQDGSQRLGGIDTTLPPGLSGKLAGIAECTEAQIAQARGREHPNEGVLEREAPSCPASSEVGTVDVAAGAGPTPFHTSGHAYLAGPYRGAPLSLAVIVPAVAGPFDLGAVVSRVALHVNPETAQIHAVSDPFPQILEGIPLDLRSVAIKMGRPQFTLNPTNCEPLAITGLAKSPLGDTAALAEPFQVGGCAALPFKPKLSLRLKGSAKRGAHPALSATLTMRGGEANIAKAAVTLPRSEFLDQAHIGTVCTRLQFAEGPGNGANCPPASVYGRARAITPLLDAPLEGPIFLRSSSHELPDLVAALGGQIAVALDGTVDSVKGGIRNRFEVVPDAPVSKFTLTMRGAGKGLLQNSTNICASNPRAKVKFTAQSGKVVNYSPVVKVSGCKEKRRKPHKGHGHHRRSR
jgi:hypothetical protein